MHSEDSGRAIVSSVQLWAFEKPKSDPIKSLRRLRRPRAFPLSLARVPVLVAWPLVSEMPRPALDANGDGTLRSRADRRAVPVVRRDIIRLASVPEGSCRMSSRRVGMRRFGGRVCGSAGRGSPRVHCPARRRAVILEGGIGSASICQRRGWFVPVAACGCEPVSGVGSGWFKAKRGVAS